MTQMTKDELVRHLTDSGYSLEAAQLAAKDAPDERDTTPEDQGTSQGHQAMNAAIRSALGQDVHADPAKTQAEMNDAIRRAAGRTPEQEEDR